MNKMSCIGDNAKQRTVLSKNVKGELAMWITWINKKMELAYKISNRDILGAYRECGNIWVERLRGEWERK